MSFSDDLSHLEKDSAIDAIVAVRCRAEEPGGAEAMVANMTNRNAELRVIPDLILRAFDEDLTNDQRVQLRRGALLALLVICELADVEDLEQEFPDMPKVPRPRLGT